MSLVVSSLVGKKVELRVGRWMVRFCEEDTDLVELGPSLFNVVRKGRNFLCRKAGTNVE